MATIYEVSELAGVSLATVSRVMNNSGNVRAKTRKKVEQAIAEPGYRPNSFQDRPSPQTVKQKPKSNVRNIVSKSPSHLDFLNRYCRLGDR